LYLPRSSPEKEDDGGSTAAITGGRSAVAFGDGNRQTIVGVRR
jgi:hypothetical protein